ncbi:SDR family oxidoreductase [Flavobacterium saliperosum]|uniref:Nucleoside-diphosphate-sugar epimerase n=2 Tax=Flavobacterium saliperosum TaxID=329186 RepID=A0A1G4W740_9FLAO|nr:SDR family oxidoreductase [Flavobacterium saliperosum]SCX17790.1 Nucleoside-diphosphate-sugar epimerase [Flavobacterium saliperosum]
MKRNKPNIAILGCGWLGFPLAKRMVAEGFMVKGSTTSAEKIALLNTNGITPYQIALSEDGIQGPVADFLEDSEILIIDIPPGLRKVTLPVTTKTFVSKIEKLIPYLEKSSLQKVLFVSSTSVYADENETVTEDTVPNPETESGRQLAEIETLLRTNPNFDTSVIRFGGLIGPDRHPVQMLAGRENLDNPEAPVNLIHQEDCIGIILKIIEKEAWKETFNAVAPQHPTRKAYYHKKAEEMNLAIPKFASGTASVGKLISGKKTEEILNYTFVVNLL